ncbi:ribosome small subunit-dependent GTPase A [Svornostia abyssi]|uniref:Small ribosomal subunit biogenesis GTPase RsgA n=1 Tax=Svornostia abyssi TaxID=2898438 RepID=A0ABY5PLS3_9ACTN|nr:ribosome small subunit-dependent GTPase A [Parviterribacteraceae bacterium J379]
MLARVVAQHTEQWLVQPAGDDGPPRLAPARGRLRETGTPVTGDWVALDEGGAIAHILERRGTIIRRAPGEVTDAQVLAANVDLALIVEPLPEPNTRRAERLVALASADDVPATLVLTKADRADDGGDETAAALARQLGLLEGLAVCAKTGEGLGALRTLLRPGETIVLLGVSGAGKSTLVNALLGEERQATAAVRAEDDRGRHTTVTRELITLPNGALLLDTPGIREVGLWDGVGETFTDIEELALRCRFPDCAHITEPGCAVRDTVDPVRVEAWRKLVREQQWIEDRRAAARQREERGKSYGRLQVEARRAKGRDD